MASTVITVASGIIIRTRTNMIKDSIAVIRKGILFRKTLVESSL